MTLQSKKIYWNKKATDLTEIIDQLHYGELDVPQMLLLRELTNIIKPVGHRNRMWRKNGFLIGTEQDYIYEELENAFWMGQVVEEVNRQLHLHEKYEILAELVKM